MRQFDPKGFGKRLTTELGERKVKWFAQALRQGTGGAKGTSYGQVWAYVNGEAAVEPRDSVVKAMASLLGVRADYLLYDGPRTEYDRAIEGRAVDDPHGQAMSAANKVFRDAFLLSTAAQSQVWRVWSAMINRESETARHGNLNFADTENVDVAAVAAKLVRSLRTPLEELGLYDSDTSSLALDSYVIMACEALMAMLAQDVPRLGESRTVRFKHKGDDDA